MLTSRAIAAPLVVVACAFACAFACACGPTSIEVAGPVPEAPRPPPPPPLAAHRPAQPLQVAGPATRPVSRRIVTVDAENPRTPLGHFPAGARVRIAIVETRWNHAPTSPFFDAGGKPDEICGSPGHTCVGGNGAAPLMGLILLTSRSGGPLGPPERSCAPRHRLFIPQGVEFAVPEDTDLALAPNDWEDGLFNNSGHIRVRVETSTGKSARATSNVTLEVDAKTAQTPLGRFLPGQYVKISVLGGRWTHDPASPPVDAGGMTKALCQATGGHLCPGGDSKAPLMGLILLVGPCATAAPRPAVERRFIPSGVEVVLDRAADLALGPNDWEDGCWDNAGAAIVDVEAELP